MRCIVYGSIHKEVSLYNKFKLPTIGYYKISDAHNYWEAKTCCNKLHYMIAFIDKELCMEHSSMKPDGLPRIKFCPFCGRKPVIVKGIKNDEEVEIYSRILVMMNDDKQVQMPFLLRKNM